MFKRLSLNVCRTACIKRYYLSENHQYLHQCAVTTHSSICRAPYFNHQLTADILYEGVRKFTTNQHVIQKLAATKNVFTHKTEVNRIHSLQRCVQHNKRSTIYKDEPGHTVFYQIVFQFRHIKCNQKSIGKFLKTILDLNTTDHNYFYDKNFDGKWVKVAYEKWNSDVKI